MKVQAIFERHGRWYVGYIPAVPGVHAQERTLKATRLSLLSALVELRDLDPRALASRGRRVEEREVPPAGKAS